MAVGSVFAEADVGDDEEGGEAGAEEADGLNDGTFGVVCCCAEGVFDIGGDGDAEEDYGAQAFAHEGLEVGDQFVDAPAVLVGEGRYEGFFVILVGDEERVYEHRLGLLAGVRVGNGQGCCTFVNCLSACHDRVRGWLYPPCNWLEMSPEMLTLVACVLVYDRAYEPAVDLGDGRCDVLSTLSLNAMSETRVENDIVVPGGVFYPNMRTLHNRPFVLQA